MVADSENHRVQFLDPDTGKFKFKFGQQGSTPGRFQTPLGIAIDNSGNLLVCDLIRVNLFTPKGEFITYFGGLLHVEDLHPTRFHSPSTLVVNTDGSMIACEWRSSEIVIANKEGFVEKRLGCDGGGEGQFSKPWSLTVDKNGIIVVCDSGNGRIQFFSPQGEFLKSFGKKATGGICNFDGDLVGPKAVAIAPNGDLFVVDSTNHKVLVYTESKCGSK